MEDLASEQRRRGSVGCVAYDGIERAVADQGIMHLIWSLKLAEAVGMLGGRIGCVLRGVVLAGSALPLLGLAGCGTNTNPDFTLTVAQPSVTLNPGGTATVDFSVGAVKGSHGSITLSLNGLPTGTGVAPATATVGIGSSQQFILTAATSAPVTTAPVTITATGLSGLISSSGLVTHTATFALTIAAPPPAAP